MFAGCGDSAETADSQTAPPVEASQPAAPSVNLQETAAPVPPPGATAAPAAPADTGSAFGGTATDGLPSTDDEGKDLSTTIAKLQYAVDAYYRNFDTQVADDDSPEAQARLLPKLTSLDQLVRMRMIRAIPAAPDGKKYVLEAESRKVVVK